MRVGIVNPFPLSYSGGVEKFIDSLQRGLSKRGVDSDLISLSEKESSILPKSERFSISLVVLKRLLQREKEFDIIHANGWIVWLLRFVKKRPAVMTDHGTEGGFLRSMGGDFPLIPRLYRKHVLLNMERIGLGNSKRIAAVSKAIKMELVDDYGVEGDKIDVIYNGIDPYNLKYVRDIREEFPADTLLLFVGRLTKQKGLEYLLSSLTMLKGHDYKLLIAGEGSERMSLIKKAKELGVDSRVVFLGNVSEKRKLELLKGSDVFVSPSLWESFGIVVVEAMAAGLPILATNAGAISEVVGDSGVTVNPRDPDALGRALVKLIGDEAFRKKLGRNAMRRFRANFTTDSMAEKYVKFYESVLEDG